MSVRKTRDLDDGSTVVVDDRHPGVEIVLKPGQWEQCEGQPDAWQRAEKFRDANATGTAEEQGVVQDEDNNKGNERDREEATGQR